MGASVGSSDSVGWKLRDGSMEGLAVGICVGVSEGPPEGMPVMVGLEVVGDAVGRTDMDGDIEGGSEGLSDAVMDGKTVTGLSVGTSDAYNVGMDETLGRAEGVETGDRLELGRLLGRMDLEGVELGCSEREGFKLGDTLGIIVGRGGVLGCVVIDGSWDGIEDELGRNVGGAAFCPQAF